MQIVILFQNTYNSHFFLFPSTIFLFSTPICDITSSSHTSFAFGFGSTRSVIQTLSNRRKGYETTEAATNPNKNCMLQTLYLMFVAKLARLSKMNY